jgi:CubicO group peptidase (beta-lactamase class C family)
LTAASTSTLTRKLNSIFSSLNNSTPGVAITVLQNGKMIVKKAYGMASYYETALVMPQKTSTLC